MKNIAAESESLIIEPRTAEEMEILIAGEKDGEMKKAYGEMYAGMKASPERSEWSAEWKIKSRDGSLVGGIGFKGGPDKNGTVDIGYGIFPEFRNRGYASEAVGAMVKWAFTHKEVKAVQAQTDPGNFISQRVLSANGFVRCGTGDEGPMFRLDRKP